MKHWPPYLAGITCIALLSAGLQQACDGGTANVPHAEAGTPRYDYCHGLPLGHPWALALLAPLGILALTALVLGRHTRSSWLAVGLLVTGLAVHLGVVGHMSGNYTI